MLKVTDVEVSAFSKCFLIFSSLKIALIFTVCTWLPYKPYVPKSVLLLSRHKFIVNWILIHRSRWFFLRPLLLLQTLRPSKKKNVLENQQKVFLLKALSNVQLLCSSVSFKMLFVLYCSLPITTTQNTDKMWSVR